MDPADIAARTPPAAPKRRSFLAWSSAAIVSALAFGFKFPELSISQAYAQRGAAAAGAVDLGSGDLGVLNYAYALEQLEAAFYTQALATPYSGMNDYEKFVLTELRAHEVSHVEFFRTALGRNRIPDLEVNFKAVNFASRESVLTTSRTFEDLGVSAYNGAGQLLRNPAYLTAAGRIVSIEARHAAIIRDLIAPLDDDAGFAGDDGIDANGLDVVRLPSQVLPLAAPFIVTPVTARQLP